MGTTQETSRETSPWNICHSGSTPLRRLRSRRHADTSRGSKSLCRDHSVCTRSRHGRQPHACCRNNPRPEPRIRPSCHLHRQSTSNDLSSGGLLPKQRDPLHARPQGFRSREEGVSCRDNSVCHRVSLAAIRSHVCTTLTLSHTSHCTERRHDLDLPTIDVSVSFSPP
jgi:hypothetical protein